MFVIKKQPLSRGVFLWEEKMNKEQSMIQDDRVFPEDFRYLTKDVITRPQIDQALLRLHHFLWLPMTDVSCLEELSQQTSGVGSAVHAIVVGHGVRMGTGGYREYNTKKKTEEWVETATYCLKAEVHDTFVFATENETERTVTIDVSKNIPSKERTFVRIPFDRDIPLVPAEADTSQIVARTAGHEVYPTRRSTNSRDLKVYRDILQTTVAHFLTAYHVSSSKMK